EIPEEIYRQSRDQAWEKLRTERPSIGWTKIAAAGIAAVLILSTLLLISTQSPSKEAVTREQPILEIEQASPFESEALTRSDRESVMDEIQPWERTPLKELAT